MQTSKLNELSQFIAITGASWISHLAGMLNPAHIPSTMQRPRMFCCACPATADVICKLLPCVARQSVCVHREGGGLQALGETFVLDTAAGEWRWPEMAGAKPPARNAATMDLTSGGQLLLHGGWVPFVSTFNDTWLLPATRG